MPDFALVFLRELRVFVVCNIFKLITYSEARRYDDTLL